MDYRKLLCIKASAGCNYLKLKLKWSAKVFIIARVYVMANKVEVSIQIQNDQYIDWLWLWSQQLLFDSQTLIHHFISEYRCLLHTDTAEWVVFADTTKGNSLLFFYSLINLKQYLHKTKLIIYYHLFLIISTCT